MFFRVQFSTDGDRFGKNHDDRPAIAEALRQVAARLVVGWPISGALTDEKTGAEIGHYELSPDPAHTAGQVSELEDRISRAREYLACAGRDEDVDKADAILDGREP